MGVKFFEHLGGRTMYLCSTCLCYLTNKEHLISSRFTSSSGPALLFRKVVNIEYGEREFRHFVTGDHFVRDIYCKKCSVRLGWFYEFATENNQRYKEGKTILEEAMVFEVFNEVEFL